MQLELITTGEEVLSGQITDTNASWVCQLLEQHGLPVRWRSTVGDRREDLVRVFQERSKEADVIIVNGGLGPTVDDLSAETAAEAMGEPLVMFDAWVAKMETMFARFNRKLSEENKKQALLPKSAEIIDNPVGTACGFRVKLNRALLYFTPGVPHEFKKMMSDEILPDIKRTFQIKTICTLTRLHCFGIAESRLDGLLRDIPLPEGISLGFRSHLPEIEVKIMARGEDQTLLDQQTSAVAEAVRERMGENLLYEGDINLTKSIQSMMIAGGHTLSLAESCTGGMIAEQLVHNAGSSAFLDRGFVTYSNAAKHACLGIPMELIDSHGAVSMETAEAMARGAKQAAGTSHALSVTGIAGPDGGSDEKPVGTVVFGLATPEQVYVQTLKAPSWGRSRIRAISAAVSLDMLRRHLENKNPFGAYDLARRIDEKVIPL